MVFAGLAWLTGTAWAAGPTVGTIVNVTADQQEWIQDQLWCGLGDVHLTYQEISLRCDEIEVDQTTMHLHAEGHVILDQADSRMTCSRLEFDLNRKVGTFYDVQAFFPPTYNFRGEEMEKLDETHYRFHRGLFTSCKLGDKAPPWSIEVRDAVVEIEGYGHFRGASLKVKGTPIFYTPRLLWPVKRDRAAGLLVPSFGFNSTHGAYLGNSFYWPISRSFDTTAFLDLYSKHFLGVADEMRWAPAEHATGEVLFAFVYDPGTKRWEWKAVGKHRQLFAGGWSLNANLDELSDLDFFRQFAGGFSQYQSRLDSYIALSRAWGPEALNIRAERTRTFTLDPIQLTTSEADLERLGEVEYRLRSTRIGQTPLYVSAVGSADAFRVDQPPTLRGSYGRFYLFPSVSLLTPGFPWLNVTPTVGANETYYTARTSANGQELLGQPYTRQYGTGGLAIVGPSFSRVWGEANGDKIKHLIEPRLDYTYISNPGTHGAGATTAPPIVLVDDKDSLLVSNEVQWALANVLYLKKGPTDSREVARLEISQPYSLSTPLTVDTFFGGQSSTTVQSLKGPLSLWLNLKPLATTSLDARASLDPVTHNLESTIFTGSFFQGTNAATVTWSSSYNPITGSLVSSQATLILSLAPPKARWQVQSQEVYDIHNRTLLGQHYIVHWRGSCWGALFEFKDDRNPSFPSRGYRIAIDLTGLGTFLDIHGAMDALAH
ncbi:MAG: LPS-assembly protein LptD [Thermoanaerobaculales bacterium]